MSGRPIDFDLYNLCSLQSTPNTTLCDIPSSPIHQLVKPKQFFNDDSKQHEEWMQCMKTKNNINLLQKELENLQKMLEEEDNYNEKQVQTIEKQNLQIAHWQKGYFTYMQHITQLTKQIQQLQLKAEKQEKIQKETKEKKINSIEVVGREGRKTYRKVVPQSKWENSTEMSETLKSLNSTANKKKGQKKETPRQKQRSSIFQKKYSILKEKGNKKEDVNAPKLSLRVSAK